MANPGEQDILTKRLKTTHSDLMKIVAYDDDNCFAFTTFNNKMVFHAGGHSIRSDADTIETLSEPTAGNFLNAKKEDMEVWKTPGDGYCGVHAISQFLRRSNDDWIILDLEDDQNVVVPTRVILKSNRL
jgi:hypothetical protein